MTHKIARTLLALGLVAAGSALAPAAAAAQSLADDLDAVERAERALVAAIRAGDLAAYDRLVADDYVVITATGDDQSKADVMASYRKGDLKFPDLEIHDVRVHVFGDAALVAARTSGLRREGERDVPNLVRYVRVFSRRDGEWKAVAHVSRPAGQ
jgi:ketosteroid isomerase-like protein